MNFPFPNFKADAGQGFDFAKGHINVFQIQQDIAFIQCIRFDQSLQASLQLNLGLGFRFVQKPKFRRKNYE
jgi:hypothetical protein